MMITVKIKTCLKWVKVHTRILLQIAASLAVLGICDLLFAGFWAGAACLAAEIITYGFYVVIMEC